MKKTGFLSVAIFFAACVLAVCSGCKTINGTFYPCCLAYPPEVDIWGYPDTTSGKVHLKKYTDVSEPGSDEVIIIGKVSVKSDVNRDFIAATRALTDEEKKGQDSYWFKYNYDKDDDYYDFDLPEKKQLREFKDGEFFYMNFEYDDDKMYLTLPYWFDYQFFGSQKSYIRLPFDMIVNIPKDTKAIYVGSFTYVVSGTSFNITDVKVKDEYEAAQKALDKAYGKHYDLYKAKLPSGSSFVSKMEKQKFKN